MTASDPGPDPDQDELEAAMTAVYRGPRQEFVARRDALVKELRTAGRGDEAKAVKSLRKPTLTAWALDIAVHQDPATVERLAAAVAGVIEAQDGRGELRPAVDRLQAAARQLATEATQAAADAGHAVGQATLGPAILAVIGDGAALESLRAGRLADVPTSGGLDFLVGAAPAPEVAPGVPADAAEPEAPPAADDGAVERARDRLHQAESAAEAARERSTAAEQAAQLAAADLAAAEDRLRQAEHEVRDQRAKVKQARQDVRTAATEAREAERAAAKARAALHRLVD